jgi:hypothetical protein
MTDIVSQIDELIDEQLAAGEPQIGYNYNDPTYPKCPHCDRNWHGLPVTEQIARMYAYGEYDEDYIVAEDDSPILCQGSDFIGPMSEETIEWGCPNWLSGFEMQSVLEVSARLWTDYASGLQGEPDCWGWHEGC